MSPSLLQFLELAVPLVVLLITLFALFSPSQPQHSKLASSYVWLGLLTFALRIPMMMVTPSENTFGRVLLVILAGLSGWFFYQAWQLGQARKPKIKK